MSLIERLDPLQPVFLDSAPVIYFVQNHPKYARLLAPLFEALDSDRIRAVTSPVTLAECLVHPVRLGHAEIADGFVRRILRGASTEFHVLDSDAAVSAARIRATDNVALADAFQIAIAQRAGCKAFLTNDHALRRVSGIEFVILDDYCGD